MTAPYWSDFVPNSTFYRILSGFHRTFATGVACRQGTLTPSGHLVLSHLGFALVLLTETTLPICDAYQTWHIYRNLHNWIERFQQNICNGCGMPAGDADSSGHLVPSLWDLHMFYLLIPILFRTCRYFTGLCSSNIPRYFLGFACPKIGQDLVSGGVSVPCWRTASGTSVIWKPVGSW